MSRLSLRGHPRTKRAVAIFYGISAILERDLGVLHRYLVSPAPRSALVIGKAISASVRGLSQALIVYLLALLIGVGIDLNPLHMIGVVAIIALGSGLFATLSLIIACMVKTPGAVYGHWPGAHYAVFFRQQCHLSALLDASLAASSLLGQPLTYEVDALRDLMLINGVTQYGLLTDFGVLIAASALLTAIGARMYARMAY